MEKLRKPFRQMCLESHRIAFSFPLAGHQNR